MLRFIFVLACLGIFSKAACGQSPGSGKLSKNNWSALNVRALENIKNLFASFQEARTSSGARKSIEEKRNQPQNNQLDNEFEQILKSFDESLGNGKQSSRPKSSGRKSKPEKALEVNFQHFNDPLAFTSESLNNNNIELNDELLKENEIYFSRSGVKSQKRSHDLLSEDLSERGDDTLELSGTLRVGAPNINDENLTTDNSLRRDERFEETRKVRGNLVGLLPALRHELPEEKESSLQTVTETGQLLAAPSDLLSSDPAQFLLQEYSSGRSGELLKNIKILANRTSDKAQATSNEWYKESLKISSEESLEKAGLFDIHSSAESKNKNFRDQILNDDVVKVINNTKNLNVSPTMKYDVDDDQVKWSEYGDIVLEEIRKLDRRSSYESEEDTEKPEPNLSEVFALPFTDTKKLTTVNPGPNNQESSREDFETSSESIEKLSNLKSLSESRKSQIKSLTDNRSGQSDELLMDSKIFEGSSSDELRVGSGELPKTNWKKGSFELDNENGKVNAGLSLFLHTSKRYLSNGSDKSSEESKALDVSFSTGTVADRDWADSSEDWPDGANKLEGSLSNTALPDIDEELQNRWMERSIETESTEQLDNLLAGETIVERGLRTNVEDVPSSENKEIEKIIYEKLKPESKESEDKNFRETSKNAEENNSKSILQIQGENFFSGRRSSENNWNELSDESSHRRAMLDFHSEAVDSDELLQRHLDERKDDSFKELRTKDVSSSSEFDLRSDRSVKNEGRYFSDESKEGGRSEDVPASGKLISDDDTSSGERRRRQNKSTDKSKSQAASNEPSGEQWSGRSSELFAKSKLSSIVAPMTESVLSDEFIGDDQNDQSVELTGDQRKSPVIPADFYLEEIPHTSENGWIENFNDVNLKDTGHLLENDWSDNINDITLKDIGRTSENEWSENIYKILKESRGADVLLTEKSQGVSAGWSIEDQRSGDDGAGKRVGEFDVRPLGKALPDSDELSAGKIGDPSEYFQAKRKLETGSSGKSHPHLSLEEDLRQLSDGSTKTTEKLVFRSSDEAELGSFESRRENWKDRSDKLLLEEMELQNYGSSKQSEENVHESSEEKWRKRSGEDSQKIEKSDINSSSKLVTEIHNSVQGKWTDRARELKDRVIKEFNHSENSVEDDNDLSDEKSKLWSNGKIYSKTKLDLSSLAHQQAERDEVSKEKRSDRSKDMSEETKFDLNGLGRSAESLERVGNIDKRTSPESRTHQNELSEEYSSERNGNLKEITAYLSASSSKASLANNNESQEGGWVKKTNSVTREDVGHTSEHGRNENIYEVLKESKGTDVLSSEKYQGVSVGWSIEDQSNSDDGAVERVHEFYVRPLGTALPDSDESSDLKVGDQSEYFQTKRKLEIGSSAKSHPHLSLEEDVNQLSDGSTKRTGKLAFRSSDEAELDSLESTLENSKDRDDRELLEGTGLQGFGSSKQLQDNMHKSSEEKWTERSGKDSFGIEKSDVTSPLELTTKIHNSVEDKWTDRVREVKGRAGKVFIFSENLVEDNNDLSDEESRISRNENTISITEELDLSTLAAQQAKIDDASEEDKSDRSQEVPEETKLNIGLEQSTESLESVRKIGKGTFREFQTYQNEISEEFSSEQNENLKDPTADLTDSSSKALVAYSKESQEGGWFHNVNDVTQKGIGHTSENDWNKNIDEVLKESEGPDVLFPEKSQGISAGWSKEDQSNREEGAVERVHEFDVRPLGKELSSSDESSDGKVGDRNEYSQTKRNLGIGSSGKSHPHLSLEEDLRQLSDGSTKSTEKLVFRSSDEAELGNFESVFHNLKNRDDKGLLGEIGLHDFGSFKQPQEKVHESSEEEEGNPSGGESQGTKKPNAPLQFSSPNKFSLEILNSIEDKSADRVRELKDRAKKVFNRSENSVEDNNDLSDEKLRISRNENIFSEIEQLDLSSLADQQAEIDQVSQANRSDRSREMSEEAKLDVIGLGRSDESLERVRKFDLRTSRESQKYRNQLPEEYSHEWNKNSKEITADLSTGPSKVLLAQSQESQEGGWIQQEATEIFPDSFSSVPHTDRDVSTKENYVTKPEYSSEEISDEKTLSSEKARLNKLDPLIGTWDKYIEPTKETKKFNVISSYELMEENNELLKKQKNDDKNELSELAGKLSGSFSRESSEYKKSPEDGRNDQLEKFFVKIDELGVRSSEGSHIPSYELSKNPGNKQSEESIKLAGNLAENFSGKLKLESAVSVEESLSKQINKLLITTESKVDPFDKLLVDLEEMPGKRQEEDRDEISGNTRQSNVYTLPEPQADSFESKEEKLASLTEKYSGKSDLLDDSSEYRWEVSSTEPREENWKNKKNELKRKTKKLNYSVSKMVNTEESSEGKWPENDDSTELNVFSSDTSSIKSSEPSTKSLLKDIEEVFEKNRQDASASPQTQAERDDSSEEDSRRHVEELMREVQRNEAAPSYKSPPELQESSSDYWKEPSTKSVMEDIEKVFGRNKQDASASPQTQAERDESSEENSRGRSEGLIKGVESNDVTLPYKSSPELKSMSDHLSTPVQESLAKDLWKLTEEPTREIRKVVSQPPLEFPVQSSEFSDEVRSHHTENSQEVLSKPEAIFRVNLPRGSDESPEGGWNEFIKNPLKTNNYLTVNSVIALVDQDRPSEENFDEGIKSSLEEISSTQIRSSEEVFAENPNSSTKNHHLLSDTRRDKSTDVQFEEVADVNRQKESGYRKDELLKDRGMLNAIPSKELQNFKKSSEGDQNSQIDEFTKNIRILGARSSEESKTYEQESYDKNERIGESLERIGILDIISHGQSKTSSWESLEEDLNEQIEKFEGAKTSAVGSREAEVNVSNSLEKTWVAHEDKASSEAKNLNIHSSDETMTDNGEHSREKLNEQNTWFSEGHRQKDSSALQTVFEESVESLEDKRSTKIDNPAKNSIEFIISPSDKSLKDRVKSSEENWPDSREDLSKKSIELNVHSSNTSPPDSIESSNESFGERPKISLPDTTEFGKISLVGPNAQRSESSEKNRRDDSNEWQESTIENLDRYSPHESQVNEFLDERSIEHNDNSGERTTDLDVSSSNESPTDTGKLEEVKWSETIEQPLFSNRMFTESISHVKTAESNHPSAENWVKMSKDFSEEIKSDTTVSVEESRVESFDSSAEKWPKFENLPDEPTVSDVKVSGKFIDKSNELLQKPKKDRSQGALTLTKKFEHTSADYSNDLKSSEENLVEHSSELLAKTFVGTEKSQVFTNEFGKEPFNERSHESLEETRVIDISSPQETKTDRGNSQEELWNRSSKETLVEPLTSDVDPTPHKQLMANQESSKESWTDRYSTTSENTKKFSYRSSDESLASNEQFSRENVIGPSGQSSKRAGEPLARSLRRTLTDSNEPVKEKRRRQSSKPLGKTRTSSASSSVSFLGNKNGKSTENWTQRRRGAPSNSKKLLIFSSDESSEKSEEASREKLSWHSDESSEKITRRRIIPRKLRPTRNRSLNKKWRTSSDESTEKSNKVESRVADSDESQEKSNGFSFTKQRRSGRSSSPLTGFWRMLLSRFLRM